MLHKFYLEALCDIIIHDISIGFIKSMFHNTNKTRMCLWSINLRETAFQQKYIDPNWFVIDIFQQRREIASKGIVKRLKSWDIFLYNNSSLALITSSFIINKFIIVFIVGSIKVKFLSVLFSMLELYLIYSRQTVFYTTTIDHWL